MAEIKITLTRKFGPVVHLRAELADCHDAVRALGLIMPGLRLVRFLDDGAAGRKEPCVDMAGRAEGQG